MRERYISRRSLKLKEKVLRLLMVGLFLAWPILPHAQVPDPSPADNITKLVEDTSLQSKRNNTPLILIHGSHGTEDTNANGLIDNDEIDPLKAEVSWANFLYYYYIHSGLLGSYKIYRFHYLSDKETVMEIARSLRNKIDTAIDKGIDQEGGMRDVPVVILAHSMGGLVARSYMNEYSHNTGRYKDKRGGERVIKLITLATPHHGSPIANSEPRFDKITHPL